MMISPRFSTIPASLLLLVPSLLSSSSCLVVAFTSPCSFSARRETVPVLQASTTSISTTTAPTSSTYQDSSTSSKFSHLDQYNLPLDVIVQEWTAHLRPETDLQPAGVYLAVNKNREKDYFVDTLTVALPRKAGRGLGIELLELVGREEDGVGITIVSGLVPGGCAAEEYKGTLIIPGDSISQIDVYEHEHASQQGDDDGSSGSSSSTSSRVVVARVPTECLNYDKTIEAIMSLPPPPAEDDDDASSTSQTILLTIKRLRRRPKVRVTFQYPPSQKETEQQPAVSLELFAGENLRRAMLVRGIKLNDPLARRFDSGGTGDCGAEGTCATCAVSIVSGLELLNAPGTTEQQILINRNPRWRMACRTIVGYGMQEGELTVRVNPKQW